MKEKLFKKEQVITIKYHCYGKHKSTQVIIPLNLLDNIEHDSRVKLSVDRATGGIRIGFPGILYEGKCYNCLPMKGRTRNKSIHFFTGALPDIDSCYVLNSHSVFDSVTGLDMFLLREVVKDEKTGTFTLK